MDSKAFNKDILEWNSFPEYDIVWCDPPWEQKMVNYFETMLQKNGFEKPLRRIEDILNHLAIKASIDKPIFIEYSIKGHGLVVEVMQKKGHRLIEKVKSLQDNGNEYLILVFNSKPNLIDGNCRGFKIINSLCHNHSFQVVFDPFAGIGNTAKAFIKNKKVYIGSELNPIRFKKLQKVISNSI